MPERGSRALWELLVLEGFQAGLSWITVLRKRPAFRAAFAGFDPAAIAGWGAAEVEGLMGNAGIIRHRGKIEAVIGNARAYQRLEMEIQGGFAAHVWGFVDGTPRQPRFAASGDLPAQTDLSRALSCDLKARGFRFCGPTIAYAFLQAAGLTNDHLTGCFRHGDVARMGGGEQ